MSASQLALGTRVEAGGARAAVRRGVLAGATLAWTATLLWLATYNLELYPTTWFDEGSHLHVPKTLVQYGVYADISSEGFRYFGPTAGVGPTVMLPVALAFKLAGVGLLQARAVMVIYLLAALALYTEVARRRYGLAAAVLASALLVSSPGLDFLYLGRQVLGEVPALAFLLLGVLLWWRSVEQPERLGPAIWAGLAFGLAALTKNQFGLILLPTFGLLLIADRFYYRQLRLVQLAVPAVLVVAAVGAGYLFQLLPLLGTEDLGSTLALWREASAGAIFVFSPSRLLSSLKFLTGPEAYAHWALPALAYGLVLASRRERAGAQQAFLVAFVLVGLGWYAFGSIGWHRYAFAPLALAGLFVGKLLTDVPRLLGRASAAGSAAAIVLLAVLIIGHPLQETARSIATTRDRGPQEMAAFIEANVPRSEIIEAWEPELGLLSDHRFHYPPSGWLDQAVRAQWLATRGEAPVYDPRPDVQPSYLVVGPFGRYTRIYDGLLSRAELVKLTTIGQYDVYRFVPR